MCGSKIGINLESGLCYECERELAAEVKEMNDEDNCKEGINYEI